MSKILDFNKGFALIEVLVASTIFFIVASVGAGLLVSAIRIYSYNLKYQKLLSQTSYAMEYMSRSLRMAKKSDGTICTDFKDKNYNWDKSDPHWIEFVNANNNKCWGFTIINNRLKAKNGNEEYYLTSNNLIVKHFNITVIGDEPKQQPKQQPKVTFYLDVQAKKGTLPFTPSIKIQTTVSQRNLNFSE